jgi:hypothetical protein
MLIAALKTFVTYPSVYIRISGAQHAAVPNSSRANYPIAEPSLYPLKLFHCIFQKVEQFIQFSFCSQNDGHITLDDEGCLSHLWERTERNGSAYEEAAPRHNSHKGFGIVAPTLYRDCQERMQGAGMFG